MEIEVEVKEKFQKLMSRGPKHMGDVLGLNFLVVSRTEMRATMPVDTNTTQPMGILHGGASVALAETLASIGGFLNLKDESKVVVGLEINANHIRPVKSGQLVTGISRPVHRGSQTQIWETRIENENKNLVCISRCTLAVIERKNR